MPRGHGSTSTCRRHPTRHCSSSSSSTCDTSSPAASSHGNGHWQSRKDCKRRTKFEPVDRMKITTKPVVNAWYDKCDPCSAFVEVSCKTEVQHLQKPDDCKRPR